MLRTGTSSLAAALSELGLQARLPRPRPPDQAPRTGPCSSAPAATTRSWSPSPAATGTNALGRVRRPSPAPRASGPCSSPTPTRAPRSSILAERDSDAWFPQLQTQRSCAPPPFFGPWGRPSSSRALTPSSATAPGPPCRRRPAGFFGGARSPEELRRRAPGVFGRHSEGVRAHVAPGRLPVYQVGQDGRAPLCEFLGRGVPGGGGEESPRVDERDSHRRGDKELKRAMAMLAIRSAAPFVVAIT